MSNSKKSTHNIISNLINEAKAYDSIESLEKLAQGGSLKSIPLQPLYLCLRSTEYEVVAQYMAKLSGEQREALLDIDLWVKDDLDVDEFEKWLIIYDLTGDYDMIVEFVESNSFLLYLKARFSIHTFDTDDPSYPDNDNYFLTEDNLLLFEYDESFQYVYELKRLISIYYSIRGVENSYANLFKVVSTSFFQFQEEEYRFKKSRLLDYGLLDYFESLEKTHPWISLAQVEKFIREKNIVTGSIDEFSRSQALHEKSLMAFHKDITSITEQVSKIQDSKRSDFVQFTFLKLINAGLSISDALKKGPLQMSQVSQEIRYHLLLGIDYILKSGYSKKMSIFEKFDFIDVHRIGKSLVHIQKQKVKKLLTKYGFERQNDESFLGVYFQEMIEGLFSTPTKVSEQWREKSISVLTAQSYSALENKIQFFEEILPFISQFNITYKEMRDNGAILDHYFLNYDVASIDFEAILISSFIHFDLGHFDEEGTGKMGVKLSDLKLFTSKYFSDENEAKFLESQKKVFLKSFKEFQARFGFVQMNELDSYFFTLLNEHLAGYNYKTLTEDEYAHIGGPILLDIKGH